MLIIVSILFLGILSSVAQQKNASDTTKKKSQIIILENDYGEFLISDTLSIQRLIGNVK